MNISEPSRPRKRKSKSGDSLAKQIEELDIHIPTYPYKSSAEYAAAVNQWLWQCYNLQCMSIALPYLVSQAACRHPQVTNPDGTTDFNRNFPNAFFPNQNLNLIPGQQNLLRDGTAAGGSQSTGTVYILPSLVKRAAAETLDFLLLLALKILITYIAVDFFDFINLDKYDLSVMRNTKLDYKIAMEVTSEILVLEFAHRVIVCLFEALFTHKGINGPGGATPGKTIMGLRIVTCDSVVPLGRNLVRVYPAGNLGIGWALARSFIKNFSYAFIFPMYLTFYFLSFNRFAYDYMCGCIVVEELHPRQQRNQ